jgi:hypothetical protein
MLIDVLYIIFTEYEGEPWKTDLLAKMVKFNHEERPSFLKIVEILEIHLKTTSIRSFFPLVSSKLFSIILNNSVYSVSRANKINVPVSPVAGNVGGLAGISYAIKINFPTKLDIAHSLAIGDQANIIYFPLRK